MPREQFLQSPENLEDDAWQQSRRDAWATRDEVRAQEVAEYRTTPLRHHADLSRRSGRPVDPESLRAFGVGPDGRAIAAWELGVDEVEIAHLSPTGDLERTSDLGDCPPVWAAQPMPEGLVLLQTTYPRPDSPLELRVVTPDGPVAQAEIGGPSILMPTPTGAVWAGYGDQEVLSSSHRIGQHGVVRFGPDLAPQWRHPRRHARLLPGVIDCYALNVDGEKAWIYAYTEFHLVSVVGDDAVDHGRVPFSGAHGLLVDGTDAILLGGYGPESDVVTPATITPSGVRLNGPPRRMVMPDGHAGRQPAGSRSLDVSRSRRPPPRGYVVVSSVHRRPAQLTRAASATYGRALLSWTRSSRSTTVNPAVVKRSTSSSTG